MRTRIPQVGEVRLKIFSTERVNGGIQIPAVDEDGATITIIADKLSCPDDIHLHYGYIHIKAYTIRGVTTKCDIYRSIE